MKKFKYLIYIGRFQPFHNGHKATIDRALDLAERVIVLIGSAKQPRTIKNPFTSDERADMIRNSYSKEDAARIACVSLRDQRYNDQKWVTDVQNIVESISLLDVNESDGGIGIIGHMKDESSYYIKMFPQWELVEMPNVENLNSTDIRVAMFGLQNIKTPKLDMLVDFGLNATPTGTREFVKSFVEREREGIYAQLRREYKFIEDYKTSWSAAPYPPTFLTADAVVIQSGHVLMIKRRAEPGRGLWALPGGFVNQNERLEDAALRELREETKLKVPEPVLRGSIKANRVFDAPNRSLRGRTVTSAYLIELPPGELPKVKGSDDAIKAQWIPLSDVDEEQCFEDHYSIIQYFLGRV